MISFFTKNKKEPQTPPACRICAQPPAYTCVACAQGACPEPWHVYHTFGTKRYGTDNDQIGSKFFYYCPSCSGLNCTECLKITSTYPCKPEDLEIHPFTCIKCESKLELIKMDNVNYAEAVDGLQSYLAEINPEMQKIEPEKFEYIKHGQTVLEYKGHDAEKTANKGDLMLVPFGPVARALKPDEAWCTLLGIYGTDVNEPEFEIIVFAQKQKVHMYWVENGERLHWFGMLLPDYIFKSEAFDFIPSEIREKFPFRIGLSANALGLHIMVHNDNYSLTAIKMGIKRTGMFLPPSEESTLHFTKIDKKPFSDGWLVTALKQVSDLKIWDYEWIEAPQDDKPEAGNVLSIAGSTDLTYYHLVHIYFFRVKYFNIRNHFSHPRISEASAVENMMFREIYSFDERTMVYAVDREWGSFLTDRNYIICNNIRVVMGHLSSSDAHIYYQANEGWWHKS